MLVYNLLSGFCSHPIHEVEGQQFTRYMYLKLFEAEWIIYGNLFSQLLLSQDKEIR